ncbi:NADPH-dependent FMN reductase [Marinilabilia sp.]|uniref:NADPH-dependent FMN reductase n=1 Tax=Marinilabilia sp. TaxID=2021252 RepID=UPI0025BA2289|nr:NAD(P)H-dependent oxidoreductase [Marinilabilia sp.]
MSLIISLLYGSVRRNRQGIKAAKYLGKKLKERNIDVRFIDPLEFKLPFLDKMYKEFPNGTAPKDMETIANHFRESDAFLVVTGEYNHSLPPALKNLLDHYQSEYLFKPSAIASYSAGSFGGVRAAVHLRVILAELGTPTISSMQPFPAIQDLFDDDLVPQNSQIEKSVDKFLDELIWYAEALAEKRKNGGTPF